MSMMRDRDYVIRMIKQLGDALAKALKLRREKKLDAALQALGDASRDLLGVSRDVLDALDPRTAAAMLAEPRKVRFYARLLAAEASLRADSGAPDAALTARARLVATLGGTPDAAELEALGPVLGEG